MKRREFISLLGSATTWPLGARAQQPERMRRIGVFMPYPEASATAEPPLKAFRDALAGLGWTAGRNLTFDYRWAGNSNDLVRTYAKEVVALAPDLILPGSCTPVRELAAALSANQAVPLHSYTAQLRNELGLGRGGKSG